MMKDLGMYSKNQGYLTSHRSRVFQISSALSALGFGTPTNVFAMRIFPVTLLLRGATWQGRITGASIDIFKACWFWDNNRRGG